MCTISNTFLCAQFVLTQPWHWAHIVYNDNQTSTKGAQSERGTWDMKLYSAVVKDGSRTVFITNQEYQTKADFIHDLRRNGYKVNPLKVKTSRTFDYIINHTDCNPWDWKLTDKEVDDITDYHPGRSMWDMEVWKENKQTGLSCGINDFGELFLGNKGSGYNLPDTPENREYILNDFDYWNQ